MFNLLRAGLIALACLFAMPAPAQDCRPFEALLTEAAALAAQGFRMEILTGDEAVRAYAALLAVTGDPPRSIEISAIILLFGPRLAVAVLGEGTQACFQVPIRLETAETMLLAGRGEPA